MSSIVFVVSSLQQSFRDLVLPSESRSQEQETFPPAQDWQISWRILTSTGVSLFHQAACESRLNRFHQKMPMKHGIVLHQKRKRTPSIILLPHGGIIVGRA